MSWPARTWIDGEVIDADLANNYWRDPIADLRSGGIAIASQAANDFIYATGATQLGRLAAVSGRVPKFNGSVWEMSVVDGSAFHPVGSILEFVVSTNPNTLLGYGTWAAFGTGRVTVGIDAGDPSFDTVEKQGGAKTVAITIAEMPSHTHTQNSHNHTQNPHSHSISGVGNDIETEGGGGIDVMDDSGTMTTSNTTATNNPATATNQNTGGDGAHNNVQPYIVVYRWKRTA